MGAPSLGRMSRTRASVAVRASSATSRDSAADQGSGSTLVRRGLGSIVMSCLRVSNLAGSARFVGPVYDQGTPGIWSLASEASGDRDRRGAHGRTVGTRAVELDGTREACCNLHPRLDGRSRKGRI